MGSRSLFSVFILIILFIPGVGNCQSVPVFNIGPWRLGMTKSQVTSFVDYGPYKEVNVTGGVETMNGIFEGKKSNISFVFEDNKLNYIQVWEYEGNDSSKAEQAVLNLYELFKRSYGGAYVDYFTFDDERVITHDALEAVLDRILGTAKALGQKEKKKNLAFTWILDMHPITQPSGSQLDAEFGYISRYDTFYVFLFQDLPNTPQRHQKAALHIEKLAN